MVRYGLERRGRREKTAEDLSGSLVTATNPDSPASEGYRALCTNLMYALVDLPAKALVVTSPNRKEGKSTACANLGVALGQVGKSTLVIDCDFRKPVMHKIFQLQNTQGVVDVLAGEQDLQEAYQETPLQGLAVLTVGLVPPNPAELLSSRRFSELMEQVRREFDYVLVDVPPTTLCADPMIVAAQADGVLVALDYRNTPKRSLRQAIRSLEAVRARVLGTIVNNVELPKGEYYGPVYGY